MPTYEYQCQCGLLFDAFAKREDRSKSKACPECKCQAQPVLPSSVNAHFNVKTSGPVPQNSGVSGIDVNVDRVIGADAREKWELVDKRNSDKEPLYTDGTRKLDVTRTPDNRYRKMTPDERKARREGATFVNTLAMNALDRQERPRKGR